LDAPGWLAAPGQGAIAVQARAHDDRLREVLARLDHAPTRFAVTAERALLASLEGGCQVPIGAAAVGSVHQMTLHAAIAALDGSQVVRGAIAVDPADPAASGSALAAQLRANGGAEILATLRPRAALSEAEASAATSAEAAS
jgi:hydroxymethylbilane synthase